MYLVWPKVQVFSKLEQIKRFSSFALSLGRHNGDHIHTTIPYDNVKQFSWLRGPKNGHFY